MSIDKRKKIFEKYTVNLRLLVENGIINNIELEDRAFYICPICTDKFYEEDLSSYSNNMLTLEDAPPKSLGGTADSLTCKRCNSICGHTIDFHLSERMRELDERDKLPGSIIRGQFRKDGKMVYGELRIKENGIVQAYHHKKANNESELEKYIDRVTPEEGKNIVDFTPKPSRVDPKRLQIALIKSAYIMAFDKFGYSFILRSEYDRIREQLLNPDKEIYPLDCWFQGPLPKEHIGVPFITEKGFESIFALFALSTNKSERLFGVIVPISRIPIENVIAKLRDQFYKKKTIEISMYKFDQTIDYLSSLDDIKHLIKWIDQVN